MIDKVYPFASTNEALAHVEGGRAKGKVVVSMRLTPLANLIARRAPRPGRSIAFRHLAWQQPCPLDAHNKKSHAGIAQLGGFLAVDSEDIARRMFETNFFTVLRMIQAFAPVLETNGSGGLINVLSVAWWVNGGELAADSASKSAARSLTKALRHELAARRTHELGLQMAYVDTDLTRGVDAPKSSPEDIVDLARSTGLKQSNKKYWPMR